MRAALVVARPFFTGCRFSVDTLCGCPIVGVSKQSTNQQRVTTMAKYSNDELLAKYLTETRDFVIAQIAAELKARGL